MAQFVNVYSICIPGQRESTPKAVYTYVHSYLRVTCSLSQCFSCLPESIKQKPLVKDLLDKTYSCGFCLQAYHSFLQLKAHSTSKDACGVWLQSLASNPVLAAPQIEKILDMAIKAVENAKLCS